MSALQAHSQVRLARLPARCARPANLPMLLACRNAWLVLPVTRRHSPVRPNAVLVLAANSAMLLVLSSALTAAVVSLPMCKPLLHAVLVLKASTSLYLASRAVLYAHLV